MEGKKPDNSTLRFQGFRQPSELIYQTYYTPVDLSQLLSQSETRSQIRRLPVPHLFFGIKDFRETQIQQLLPHITEAQWQGILDLDLWSRDKAITGKFLYWQAQIINAQDPVARKILRATDLHLLQLYFKRRLRIHEISEDDPGPAPRGEFLETPDKHYLVEFPPNPDEARLSRGLVLRLFELAPKEISLWIQESRFQTSLELEETAYQNRKRRMEEMGFQEYSEALNVYTYLPSRTPLPVKRQDRIRAVGTLPAPPVQLRSGPLFLFKALAGITEPQDLEPLLEELFFVCNKILSADGTPPDRPSLVKRALSGINIGLEIWSDRDLYLAQDGLKHHYLQSFFHTGYSRLVDIRSQAREIQKKVDLETGSFLDEALEGLAQDYPLLVVEIQQKRRRRFLKDSSDLERANQYLRLVE